MRVGGDSHGLVGVSLPFSFPYLCFSFGCWLYTLCIPFGSWWALLFWF